MKPVISMAALADGEALRGFRQLIQEVRLADEIVNYVVAIVRATREQATLLFGGSPRCATMLASAGRAVAALQGREYVIPDDIKGLAVPTLRHRVVLAPGAEIDGSSAEGEIRRILKEVPAPR